MIRQGDKKQISFRNPNITGKSVKGGWKYEFKAEITEEDYDEFKGLDLSGAEFEAWLECVVIGEETKKKGGPLSQNAGYLCQNPDFQRYSKQMLKEDEGYDWPSTGEDIELAFPPYDIAKRAIYHFCGVTSRAYLDHDAMAAAKYQELKGHYYRWLEDV